MYTNIPAEDIIIGDNGKVTVEWSVEFCHRCGHRWIKRMEDDTRTCPFVGCRSPYWDRPARKPTSGARDRHTEKCRATLCQAYLMKEAGQPKEEQTTGNL